MTQKRSRKPKKSFFQIIISIVLYLFVAVFIGSFALGTWSANNDKFDYQTYLIQSGSMEPTIMTGDIIIIQDQPNYVERDVITFLDDENRTITHRILEIKGSQSQPDFLTKGDANQSPDPDLVSLAKVQGKVIFTIPKLGYLVNFSKSKWGIILMIMVPAGLIILDELLKIGQEVAD